MLNYNYIVSVAQKANFPDSFIKDLTEYLGFVEQNPDIKTELENFHNKLFIKEDIFPIRAVGDLPKFQKSEEKYPGFFETVIYLTATKHFENFIIQNVFQNCKYDLIDTYYKNLRRFGEMNYIRDNTYALIRHGYFLYGYAKPYILHIGRLSYELRLYDNSLYDIYEDQNGDRHFIKSGAKVPNGFTRVIQNGDPYVTIHIPGNDPLTKESVLDSIQTATPILKKVFKKYNPKHFMCTSWLISPQLDNVLKPTSNIKAFGDMFDKSLGEEAPNALYEHIFKCHVCPINELKAQNDFQKNILSLYEKGEVLCNGIGILKKEFCKL